MELKLYRKIYSKNSTVGELFINGTFFCFTLEDLCRDINRDGDLNDPGEAKVYGKTAIPAGRYQVLINMSNRFKKLMPLLVNVPGFEGIRIHNGNTAAHTEGCILVGASKAVDFVGKSVDTFDKLMIRLRATAKVELIYITIIDQQI